MKKKHCTDCGCDSSQHSGSLLERIWETQLSRKEIWINGPIDDSLMYTVVTQIQNINFEDSNKIEKEPILLFINSGGGDPAPAWSIISAIRASRTPVVTVAMGRACSAAFLILLAGHAKFAQEYSELMYHQAWCWFGGPEKVLDVQERAVEMQRLNAKAEQFVLETTEMTEEMLNDVYFGKRDWYIDVDVAERLKIIDGIWGIAPDGEYEDEDESEEEEPEEYCAECDCTACKTYRQDNSLPTLSEEGLEEPEECPCDTPAEGFEGYVDQCEGSCMECHDCFDN